MASQTTVTPSQARDADTVFFVRRGATKGSQLFCLLTPPLYTAFVLARRGRSHFTAQRFLRANWVGYGAGAMSGAAFEYVRSVNTNEESLRTWRIRAVYDMSSIRADDHATIGGALFAVLTPALLWKRAAIVDLVMGGWALGNSVGLLAHHGRSLSGDHAPVVPLPKTAAEA